MPKQDDGQTDTRYLELQDMRDASDKMHDDGSYVPSVWGWRWRDHQCYHLGHAHILEHRSVAVTKLLTYLGVMANWTDHRWVPQIAWKTWGYHCIQPQGPRRHWLRRQTTSTPNRQTKMMAKQTCNKCLQLHSNKNRLREFWSTVGTYQAFGVEGEGINGFITLLASQPKNGRGDLPTCESCFSSI